MAKKVAAKAKTPAKPAPPDHLTMSLFAPGMSALHRAGLGGLACTLRAIERHHANGLLSDEALPGPFDGDTSPWEIDDQSITLRFGKPENAGGFLKRLFEFGFQIREGIIYLPGQYGDVPPSTPVLIAIQEGIQNTFLQHGPTCGSRSDERTATFSVDDLQVTVTHDCFTSYKHQGWFWLDRDERSSEKDPATGKKVKTGNRIKNHQLFPAVQSDGTLSCRIHEVDNKLLPGGMVRHDRFKASAVGESDAGLICLHFAMIGCLTLAINRVTAVLVIPEVANLTGFSSDRRLITPQTPQNCRITGAADAALQLQTRIHVSEEVKRMDVPSCLVWTCKPTKWNEKQKPRVASILVEASSNEILDRFASAYGHLSPRLVRPKQADEPVKSKRKSTKQKEPFWADSVIRPLIAENLALGRPWYAGFIQLMTKTNPATDKPFRNQLSFERKGLNAMIQDPKMWDDEGEKLIVQAVHEAIRQTLGRIREETDGEKSPKLLSQATKNRWERFREKLRLNLSGSKTDSQMRFVLTDLFSRGGYNSILRAGWEKILPVLRKDWQLARDLGLLALASYAGRGADDETEISSTPQP